MLHWLSQLLADRAGLPDEARVGFVLGVIAYIGFWCFWLAAGHEWRPEEYGVGMAALVTAYGVSLRARGEN